MAMLSDYDILDSIDRGENGFIPFNSDQLGPASYDVLLDWDIRVVKGSMEPLDLANVKPDYSEPFDLRDFPGGFELYPGQCMLASTIERIKVGEQYSAQLAGRSSMARLFQQVHVTAGFCDPGFEGNITLEVVNLMPRPVLYHYRMKVAQVTFTRLHNFADRPYKVTGQYMSQRGVQEANSIKIITES